MIAVHVVFCSLVYIFHYFVITFNGVVVSVIVIGNENFDFFR